MRTYHASALVVSLLVSGASQPALAQAADPAGGRTIRGVVYDSLDARPLPGANVMLLPRSDATQHTRAVIADAHGNFELTGVPGGVYLIGFEDPLLDSLGITAAPRQIQLAATGDEPLTVDLSVPSARTVHDAFCPAPSPTDSSSVLIGHLLDPSSGSAISGGVVRAHWLALSRSEHKVAVLPATEDTHSGADGWFGLCGLPAGQSVDIVASRGVDTSIVVTVTAPTMRGVLRKALYLAPASAPHTGRLAGVVEDENGGRPLSGAQVGVAGIAGVASTGEDGRFSLENLPYGTSSLSVSRTGYQPRDVSVDVLAGSHDSVTVALRTQASALDTAVAVVAQSVAKARGFFKRKASFGDTRSRAFLDFAQIGRSDAATLSEVAAKVWGDRIAQSDSGSGIEFTYSSPGVMGSKRIVKRTCQAVLYADGVLQRRAQKPAEVDGTVPLGAVAAVEIYSGSSVPQAFATWEPANVANRCGTIVAWLLPPTLWQDHEGH